MDKLHYQALRQVIEAEIVDYDPRVTSTDALINCVMRHFLQAISSEQARSQRIRRDFVKFRRDSQIKPPSWAFTNPALSDRLPTIEGMGL